MARPRGGRRRRGLRVGQGAHRVDELAPRADQGHGGVDQRPLDVASRSTAAASIRQRASGRRRSTPRPEHGASTSTWSNDRGANGGAVPSATTTGSGRAGRGRWRPIRPARPGRRSAATTSAPVAASAGGLAAGGGAQVGDPLPRAGADAAATHCDARSWT